MRSRLALVVAIVLVWAAGCAEGETTVESASPAQPEATEATDEPLYTCGVGPSFTIGQMWTGTELKNDEPKRVLDDYAKDNEWGDRDWRRVVESEDAVLFLGGDGTTMPYLLVGRNDDGWQKTGEGTCAPTRIRDGNPGGWWTLSPETSLGPFTRTFTALVRERKRCTDGSAPDGRVSPPEIVRDAEQVTVTFFVEASQAKPEACSWEPTQPTKVVVDLGEDLGDRSLFDGGTYPARQQGRGGPGWGAATCDSEPGSQTDLASEPHPVTADFIHRWSKGGCLIRIDVLATSAPGPDFHCAPWPQSMTMSTPLGATDRLAERLTYVRSADEAWRAEGVSAEFGADVATPPTASPTGYLSFDGAEILIDKATQDVVYLRYPDHTERWPRMTGAGCA